MRSWLLGMAVFVVVLAAGGRLVAQTGATATLRGQVKDAQGNAVTKAHVTVTSSQAGLSRQTAVDNTGAFVLADLPPGTSASWSPPTTSPSSATRTCRCALARPSTSRSSWRSPASRSRSASPPPSSTSSTPRSSVVDAVITARGHREAAAQRPQLPRAGVAGSRQRAGAELRPDEDELRARSRRPASSAAAATSPSTAWTTTTTWSADRCMNVAQDSVQEFQIATSRFSAELGRSAGSVINVVTRSGGEQLARVRRDLLPRRRAAGAAGDLRPQRRRRDCPFDRQQVAGSVGGPICERTGCSASAPIEYRNQDGARAGRRAQRRRAHDHEVVRHGAARRSARARSAPTGARAPTTA